MAGAVPAKVPLPYLHIRINSLTIKGSFAQNRQDVESTIRLIEAGNIKLRKTDVGQFGLHEVDEALKLAKNTDGWQNMVLIKP